MKEKDEWLYEANDEDTDMRCQLDPQLCNDLTEGYDLFILLIQAL